MIRNEIFALITFFVLSGTILCDFSFSQVHKSATVYSDFQREFSFPWAGGMNSCQFGTVDIDLDGVMDLVVFDRVGDRIMPFLSVPDGGSYSYSYAPQYIAAFPGLSQWVVFADYNLDGKTDIFTFSPPYPGMKVYRNDSETELSFTLVAYPYLTSFQGGGYVNILVTYADYPAISDLDGDGDLDILTFWGLGSFVEKHRNMSMEKFGTADSLDFIKTEYCWGRFAESDESNVITLDTCLRCTEPGSGHPLNFSNPVIPTPPQAGRELPPPARHTGSTFCILDLNADNLPDLLLGDVDYPNLVALYNDGNPDTAFMASYDWQYPPGETCVDLFSMPAAFYDDFDFDGIKELIVSPFDPDFFKSENERSILFYDNYGDNDHPQFNLISRSFLQDRMLDFGAGAYPVFTDANQDGLTDIVVGNYGYYDSSYFDDYQVLHTIQTGKLALLANRGSTENPAFSFISDDFAAVSDLHLKGIVPAFGDLDGDGDPDMLLGNENGDLVQFENNAGPGVPFDLDFVMTGYSGIDAGAYSAPQLFDLDRDDRLDLVIGEKSGNLNYYRNTGTSQLPVFSFVTDSLGKINVTDYAVSLDGYAVPCFYRGVDGITRLVVGTEQGDLLYFTNIDGNLDGKFTREDNLADLVGIPSFSADRGYRSAAALGDLDQDGYPELIAGNFAGGLEYFSRNGQSPVNGLSDNKNGGLAECTVYPNPATDHITVSCHFEADPVVINYSLFDGQGRIVRSSPGIPDNPFNIETLDLPGGLYLLQIIVKNKNSKLNESFSRKIVIL